MAAKSRILSRVALILVGAVAAIVIFYGLVMWSSGGLRWSSELPGYWDRIEGVELPEGFVEVTRESGEDRLCFLQCGDTFARAWFAVPDDLGDDEVCDAASLVIEPWTGLKADEWVDEVTDCGYSALDDELFYSVRVVPSGEGPSGAPTARLSIAVLERHR